MPVVGVTLSAATAHAEDCLAAPNSPAREGTRWYYRLDRATQHKCWYMRALDQPTQQVAASAKTALPAPAFAIPIPRPRPSAAASALSLSRGDPGPSSSYPEEIATKESAAPPVTGSTAETTSSIPKEFTSQKSGTSLAAAAPNAAPPIGAAADETTSAMSDTNQALRSPESDVEATAAAPDAETLAGTTTDETSLPTSDIAAPQQGATSAEPNAQVVASGPNAAPPINATIDDAASSIPKDFASQLSTSSDLRPNDAEPAPNVSLAELQTLPAVAMVNDRRMPLPPNAPANLAPDGRVRRALSDELIDSVGRHVRPFHFILAFVVVSVCMIYYIVFRYLPGGRTRISIDHPEEDYVDDDWYNNPEFYRKLRQGAVLEKP